MTSAPSAHRAPDEARRLRRVAAETGDLRFFRAAEILDAPERDGADVVANEILALRATCAAAGIVISVHGTVSERDAAQLMERSKRTLEGWRTENKGPPFVRSGARVRYALRDLAIWRLRDR